MLTRPHLPLNTVSSVWRRARRNTARSVRAVALAGAEWRDWLPRVTRGLAFQAASAASVNQAVVNQAVRLSR